MTFEIGFVDESMITDRKLTERAAKAAGIVIEYDDGKFYIVENGHHSDTFLRWRPLHDDGDALRLAVKMRLQVLIGQGPSGDITWVRAPDELDLEGPSERHGVNACAATRRAIVRAAALIVDKDET